MPYIQSPLTPNPGNSNQAPGVSHGVGKPRVSIGLPVYNGEVFISKTLEALLAQTFDDFEVIVSDNGSTDSTEEIVRKYSEADPRIRYYRNERNQGAAFNYNKTLELASGIYFKWIADDDVIRPEFLSRCVEILDTDPSVALVYTKSAFIGEEGKVIYTFDDVMDIKPWSDRLAEQTIQMLQAIFLDGRAANVVIFGLARTDALRSIRPLGNYYGCDLVIVTELSLIGRIVEIQDVLSFYRKHERSSSSYGRNWRIKGWRTPSAANQQLFIDPNVKGRLKAEFQLRRRYFEIVAAVMRSNLGAIERLRILFSAFMFLVRKLIWRLRFEVRIALGNPVEEFFVSPRDGIGKHWSQF